MVLLEYDSATGLKKYIVMCFLDCNPNLSQIFTYHASVKKLISDSLDLDYLGL